MGLSACARREACAEFRDRDVLGLDIRFDVSMRLCPCLRIITVHPQGRLILFTPAFPRVVSPRETREITTSRR